MDIILAQEAAVLTEKYKINTDRNYYVAGEDIQFNVQPLLTNSLSKVLYIDLVNSSGQSSIQKRIELTNNGSYGFIGTLEDLPSGYYNLYAYTKWQRNFGVQYFTKKKLFIVNAKNGIIYNNDKQQLYNVKLNTKDRKPSQLTVKTKKKKFGQREKVEVGIKSLFEKKLNENLVFSVSVTKFIDSFTIMDESSEKSIEEDIVNKSVNILTETKGAPISEKVVDERINSPIDEPVGLLITILDSTRTTMVVDTSDVSAVIENLLKKKPNGNLTMSVSVTKLTDTDTVRVKKMDKSTDEYLVDNPINFLPETKGAYISGKVVNVTTNRPIAVSVIITVLDSLRTTKVVNTDEGGQFITMINNLNDANEILFQLRGKLDTYKIIIDNDFETHFPKTDSLIPKFATSTKESLKQMMLNYQATEHYKTVRGVEEQSFKPKELFYGEHDSCYYLQKYIDLPTMEEVLNNIIINVLVKKRKNKYELIIYDENKRVLNFPALILVDGIPIYDIDKLMKIPPSKIEKIALINSDYQIGDSFFGGIISLFSNEGDFAGIKLPKSSYLAEYELAGKPSNKECPKTYLNPRNLPDLRNTLYWNPQLEVGKDGEANFSFYTSDEKGTFIIKVIGVTPEGDFINGFSLIEVN